MRATKKALMAAGWVLGLLVFAGAGASVAADYSPGVGTDYPKQVYFGDLHLHSNMSPDAFAMGNLALSQADAYRFARGEEVIASGGLPARL